MPEEMNTPEMEMENESPVEEENTKVDRLMTIFEALSPDEQQAAFDRMWALMVTDETPIDAPEEWPLAEEDAVWTSPLDAISARLSEW